MKTKLNELLKFPCSFSYKVIGLAQQELINRVVIVMRSHISGDYTLNIKSSSKGNYYSISIDIHAINIEQIEKIYEELGKIEIARIIL